jgi:GntR family transcriptional regulator, regulator for abcA and norABC
MRWTLDEQREHPLFRQIAAYLEADIVQGELQSGDLLPAERSLAKQLGVNRSTVRAAYDELRADGLIQSVQGRGSVVVDDAWDVSLRRRPNWPSYIASGSFLPTRPLMQTIQTAKTLPGILDMSRIELSQDLLPKNLYTLVETPNLQDVLGYPDPAGWQGLRETIVAHCRQHYGVEAEADEVLVTAGGQQAFHLITQCLLSSGDAVALENPSYGYSLPLFLSAGLRLVPLPMDDGGIIPKAIPALYHRHKLRMLFVNPTYQNPTGTVLSLARRQELVEICETLKLPIVEDDPFMPLHHTETPTPVLPSLTTLSSVSGLVLHIGSISKTAAPGLRIGWMIGPRRVIARLADAKYQMDYGTSLVSQRMTERYLREGHWKMGVARIRQVLTKRMQILQTALRQTFGDSLSWRVPTGAGHLWLRHHLPVSDRELLQACIAQGILVTPGSIFGSPTSHLRLTVTFLEDKSIDEAVRRLHRAFQACSLQG